jgi:hypothetical protein
MKKSKHYFSIAGLFVYCISGSIFFISCETYNFSQPQPVDKENIYEFPSSFQGKWVSKYQEEGKEAIYIYRQYIKYVNNRYKQKIINGAWPRIDSNGNFIQSPFWGRSLYKINYDSLKRPIDTVTNYLLKEGYIYEITGDSLIENGNPYYPEKDTFFVTKKDSIVVDLGQNAFLRKVNDTLYVFNILNRTLGMENTWWQVVFMNQNKDGSITFFGCDSESEKLPSLFYQKHSNYYYNSKWTAAEIPPLIKQGYFSEGDVLVKEKK